MIEPGLINAEVTERDGDTDDIHDGINGADFVKVNVFQRHAMNAGFRFRDGPEEAMREDAGSCRQPALVEQFHDVAVVPVRVLFGMTDHQMLCAKSGPLNLIDNEGNPRDAQ